MGGETETFQIQLCKVILILFETKPGWGSTTKNVLQLQGVAYIILIREIFLLKNLLLSVIFYIHLRFEVHLPEVTNSEDKWPNLLHMVTYWIEKKHKILFQSPSHQLFVTWNILLLLLKMVFFFCLPFSFDLCRNLLPSRKKLTGHFVLTTWTVQYFRSSCSLRTDKPGWTLT